MSALFFFCCFVLFYLRGHFKNNVSHIHSHLNFRSAGRGYPATFLMGLTENHRWLVLLHFSCKLAFCCIESNCEGIIVCISVCEQ